MNPVYLLFARIYHYIHTLIPEAVVEQLPVATVFVLNIFLVAPITQIILVIETLSNLYFGTMGTVVVWVIVSAFTFYWLLDKKRVARILHRYPIKPASKSYAKAFFGAMVLFTLLIKLFPVARMLK